MTKEQGDEILEKLIETKDFRAALHEVANTFPDDQLMGALTVLFRYARINGEGKQALERIAKML